eukprot:CAMPEP_0197020402 /NCGR_PEP_ID=MMETSP1384-20130603/1165_1 /TAXON_ID=29189 /ORGANISM="Ammonia sp." /LENGTH=242 /DNA_ID=CAMNT_0042448013 /DNA_START=93 /DNA_END=821 /DNA_ORIENTATION=+
MLEAEAAGRVPCKQTNGKIAATAALKPASSHDLFLHNEMLKEKALNLLQEKEELTAHGGDAGFLTFIHKYLRPHIVDKIFDQFCIVDEISDLRELQQTLEASICLYKATVTTVKNQVFESHNVSRAHFNKTDIKPVAKFLSEWILKNFGPKNNDDGEDYDDDEIYITKQEYSKKLHEYLCAFLQKEHKLFKTPSMIIAVPSVDDNNGDEDEEEAEEADNHEEHEYDTDVSDEGEEGKQWESR